MAAQQATSKQKVAAKEIWGHALGGVGQNLIYALWSGYITAFYTDVFGMNPAVMAAIFLTARIWDALNDPLMGMLADRTKSRFGRYRCWLLRMPPIVAVCLVLNFTVPQFGPLGNTIYAAVTYILMGMAFTGVDISFWSLPAAMTSDPHERTKIFTVATLGTNVASTVGSFLIPLLLVGFGGTKSPRAYTCAALLFGLMGAALYLVCFALVREHVQPPLQKFSFALAIRALLTNKPLFCIMITNLVINLAFIMKMSLNYYYTSYTLGNFHLMSAMSIVTLPAILTGTLLAPCLAKRIGKKYTLLGFMLVNFAVSVLFFIVGYQSIAFVLLMGGLQTLCVGAAFVMISSMTADTIEYGEWKTGQRNEGIITSTRTLITKIASALVGVAVAAVLMATGYTPYQEPSDQTVQTFHFAVSLLPGLVMLLGAVPMLFYTLTEQRHAEIVKELSLRSESLQQKEEL